MSPTDHSTAQRGLPVVAFACSTRKASPFLGGRRPVADDSLHRAAAGYRSKKRFTQARPWRARSGSGWQEPRLAGVKLVEVLDVDARLRHRSVPSPSSRNTGSFDRPDLLELNSGAALRLHWRRSAEIGCGSTGVPFFS
jgi:hypothetical protein